MMLTPEDKAFAQRCLQQRLVPRPQLEAALRQVQQERGQGRIVALSEVMLRQRLLSPAQVMQVKQLLSQQAPAAGSGAKGKAPGSKGQGARDKGQGARDKGQGARDKGQGARDKGQGRAAKAPRKAALCPACSEPVTAAMDECPVCGAELTALDKGLDVGLSASEFECPRCGKTLAKGAPFCNGCGADFCPQCRHANDRGATHCAQCQTMLVDEEGKKRAVRREQRRQYVLYGVAGGGVIGLMVEALVLFL